jgi:DNA polymerase III sliding clamp (beta) subunit (PCNA family)
MQITIPRSELKQAVAGLSRVVPKRATLPILQTVRFSGRPHPALPRRHR